MSRHRDFEVTYVVDAPNDRAARRAARDRLAAALRVGFDYELLTSRVSRHEATTYAVTLVFTLTTVPSRTKTNLAFHSYFMSAADVTTIPAAD